MKDEETVGSERIQEFTTVTFILLCFVGTFVSQDTPAEFSQVRERAYQPLVFLHRRAPLTTCVLIRLQIT